MEKYLLEFVRVIVEIIAALVAAWVLLKQYISQRKKEQLEIIIENKRKTYSQFLNQFASDSIDAAHERMELRTADEDKQLAYNLNLLLIYGNDKVLKAYNVWRTTLYQRKDENNSQVGIEEFGSLLFEIRKDIQRDTKLTVMDIINIPHWTK